MKRMFALIAVAGLMLAASPVERAQAMSLSSPGIAGTAKYASEGFTTEVRGGHGGGRRGGGGRHFGGGGRHWRDGGRHWGGRRFYGGPSYYAPRRCRIVLTYYGPRRVCRPRYRW
jgi:hypothetical protein